MNKVIKQYEAMVSTEEIKQAYESSKHSSDCERVRYLHAVEDLLFEAASSTLPNNLGDGIKQTVTDVIDKCLRRLTVAEGLGNNGMIEEIYKGLHKEGGLILTVKLVSNTETGSLIPLVSLTVAEWWSDTNQIKHNADIFSSKLTGDTVVYTISSVNMDGHYLAYKGLTRVTQKDLMKEGDDE